ncbi:MAG: hypothetical protein KBS83_07720 [Lachnospiraceae bacterium]|nr:hypothetical protein [Candidatus Equihabitans merdae]
MKDISGPLFKFTCGVSSLVILGGGIYMCVSSAYNAGLQVLILTVGLLLNILMSSYYILQGKKRSFYFVVLSLILAWNLLSRALDYLAAMQ